MTPDDYPAQPGEFAPPGGTVPPDGSSGPSRRSVLRFAGGAALAGIGGVFASVLGQGAAYAATACTNGCANWLVGCLNYCKNTSQGGNTPCTAGCNNLYRECLDCCNSGKTTSECVPPAAPNAYSNADRIPILFLTFGGRVLAGSLKAKLIMQPDGNLVVYDEFNRARWASRTVGSGGYTLFQPDGNFVVYHAGRDGTQLPVWASNTCCRTSSYLSVQDDGNVVVYNSANVPLWSTRTGH